MTTLRFTVKIMLMYPLCFRVLQLLRRKRRNKSHQSFDVSSLNEVCIKTVKAVYMIMKIFVRAGPLVPTLWSVVGKATIYPGMVNYARLSEGLRRNWSIDKDLYACVQLRLAR